MTDTGQVPGEGQPESAGMVEQPGVPAHGAYTYLSEAPAEDEDLLLPGAQGAWGNEVPPPAPEPVVEAVHEPGPHETAGRDSGSVDLGGVRLPDPAPASVPPSPILSAPQDPSAATQPPRRPLHLGPPIPDASASPVRSLADRGPAGVPVRQPGAPAAGPEYLDAQPVRDMAPQSAAPWGAAPTAPETAEAGAPVPAAVAQVGATAPAGETVDPAAAPADPVERTDTPGAAQAAVPVPGTAQTQAQVVHGHDGVQSVHGHDGVYTAPAGTAPESVQPSAVAPGPEGAVASAAAEGPDGVPTPVPGYGPEGVQQPSGEAGQGAPGGTAAVEGGLATEGVAGAPAAQVEAGLPAEGAVVASEAEQAVAVAADAAGDQATAVQGTDASPAAGTAPVNPAEPGPEQRTEAPAEVQAVVPTVPAQATPAQAQVAAEASAPAQPGGAPEQVEGAPVADAGQASAVPEGAVTAVPAGAVAAQASPVAEGAAVPQTPAAAATAVEGTVPAQRATETPNAVPVQQAPDAAQVAPQPDPHTAAVAEPQPGAVAGPASTAHHASAAEAVPAPEPTATAVPDPGTPATQEAEAPSAAPAPVAADGTGTPEPHPYPAQGPQLAGPVAAAETVPGAPQPGPAGEPHPQAQPEPVAPHAVHQVAAAPETAPATDPGAPAGPQTQPAEAAPAPAAAETESTPEADPVGASPAPPETADQPEQTGPLPPNTPSAPDPGQPLGQFVPVEGQVPTTPHLAPTPPQPLVLPTQDAQQPVATVPAPREGEPVTAPAAAAGEHAPDVVQQAEDLQTRAADQEELEEESTAAVAEAAQPTGPAAPGYADAEREAVLKVMRERRDIRNGFRSDPIPHEVLLRVLEAAHTAPSVGHSQPWDFVVIRSAETRRTMHELAMRQREAYAKSLPKGRAKQFKELKIEAILDTPVNIVVTADPTRGGRHTLGRYTQPQMAPYSSALAVENLWLAARAEGLGVGWVSFFDEREMVRALGLPEHLEVVAYLCVGYVDEFPDEPELMQAGWSKRRPLSWVVHEETYGRRALPGEEPHDLLAETVAQIRPLDAKALGEAWERQKRMTKPAGALGMLEIISAQLSGLSRQCPPPIPEPAAVAIFAGDHGVHAQGVTPWPQEVTAQMVANFLGGGAVCNAFANQVGAEVCVVDVGVAADLPATPGLLPRKIRAGTSDMTTGPAMTREEAKTAIEVGIETARDLVAAGNKALLTGEMGIANTTASAALISVFTGADPAEVTGRGTGINDETLARKTEVVRRALDFHQPDPADPIGVLAAIGGFEHAAMVGLLLGGASLRTPVILDGVSAGAAALVARAIAPEVLAACIAGHRSAEPGHVAALNKLGLRPLVDLDLRLGEGTGALLALPLVQSTARAMHEVATFDSAGVTEK
ncbi:5,6-dimethylbenzimidazole synthase [Streptomyces sp. IMTB 2501]|uniref:nicotinate-nucleotide--dimethylbenzimidazole phosphoribosyltransferase n=1 Tax=Streptomyces sp. IMTB 2501 TaxID=1776340 RepID=UPI00096C46DA|nr:nicotinate-nucleotide--dimethylbenzimidazole phosphoribosyltransferase [Streptomyces sp. IMTB 2501]OLZ72956.1 5,6-dimethylbenzimidazole synthase [Streptomyces sp. IMTB 2501]